MNTETIEVFPWNDGFVTGIDKIDAQHKKLVQLINKLASHLFTNTSEELINNTFTELAEYTTYHFQTEECVWEGYLSSSPDLEEHKKTHASFLPKVLKIKESRANASLEDVLEEIILFLIRWLSHHILGNDMRMSKIVLGMQSGLSIKASIQKADTEMPYVMQKTPLGMYDHLCERTLALKKEAAERIEYTKKLTLLSQVFHGIHEGITVTDADKKIIDVNPAFSAITGYSLKDVRGLNPRILSSGKQGREFYADMWQSINEHGHWQGEIWNRKKNGELYAESLTISKLVNDENEVINYVGVFTDITQSKKHKEKLNFMAHYDLLTGLPNRALFNDRFKQAIARSKRTKHQLAICFLDLDKFKPINDNYSHSVGDQLLVLIGARISSILREDDTVSRQGGDEFAILLNDIDSIETCHLTLEKIHHSLSTPYLIEGHFHNITVSTGATLFPSDNADIDTLLRHADHAMYQAKQAGRNQYHLFNAEEDQQITHKRERLEAIKRALIDNEFCLYYQPKVNMVTGKVFGVEALIRWEHPEKGLVPPLEFLPITEGTELEIQIGVWVINEALKELNLWHQQGFTFNCSINISPKFLLTGNFLDVLDQSLKNYPAVDPSDLELEILESSAIGDLSVTRAIIENCQTKVGVKVSLDDFGTGYSSLTHLRSLPVNTVKIDQVFIRDMLDDPSDYAIVDGVIGLANSFNRKVIAEGVETTEHGLMLIAMGCHLAQGYGIARPMPAKDLPEWVTEYIPNIEWINSGSEHLPIKGKKVKLYQLTSERWKKRFLSNINSSLTSTGYEVPINNKECHYGAWLERAKHEKVFGQHGLLLLEAAHEKVQAIATDLEFKYQSGELVETRDGLEKFYAAFDEMSEALERCVADSTLTLDSSVI